MTLCEYLVSITMITFGVASDLIEPILINFLELEAKLDRIYIGCQACSFCPVHSARQNGWANMPQFRWWRRGRPELERFRDLTEVNSIVVVLSQVDKPV